MRTFFAAAVISITTIFTGSISFAGDKLNPGSTMPGAKIEMRNTDGKKMDLSSNMKKNGLLVIFSCNTCPFVIKNQQVTLKTIAYAQKHDIGVVVINSNEARRDGDDSYTNMKAYAAEQGYNVPYLADDNASLADLFGANHTPEIFLFNNKSVLVYMGAMNDNPSEPENAKKAYIQDAIDATVAGKQPNPATTKSVGCSIKRKA